MEELENIRLLNDNMITFLAGYMILEKIALLSCSLTHRKFAELQAWQRS
jgi:hypothetical protein